MTTLDSTLDLRGLSNVLLSAMTPEVRDRIAVVDEGPPPPPKPPSNAHVKKSSDSDDTRRARRAGDHRALQKLFNEDDKYNDELRDALKATQERLDAQARLTKATQSRLIEFQERERLSRSARRQAEADATRAALEAHKYRVTLEAANREALKAQELVNNLEAERQEADAAAARARSAARKLQNKLTYERAIQEGRRQGVREGRQLGFHEGVSEGWYQGRDVGKTEMLSLAHQAWQGALESGAIAQNSNFSDAALDAAITATAQTNARAIKAASVAPRASSRSMGRLAHPPEGRSTRSSHRRVESYHSSNSSSSDLISPVRGSRSHKSMPTPHPATPPIFLNTMPTPQPPQLVVIPDSATNIPMAMPTPKPASVSLNNPIPVPIVESAFAALPASPRPTLIPQSVATVPSSPLIHHPPLEPIPDGFVPTADASGALHLPPPHDINPVLGATPSAAAIPLPPSVRPPTLSLDDRTTLRSPASSHRTLGRSPRSIPQPFLVPNPEEAQVSKMMQLAEEEAQRLKREEEERETARLAVLLEEQQRKEREEHERLELERLELKRLEEERLEQARLEQARLEEERLERERLERERLEREEQERKDREERERLEREKLERLEREIQERREREEQEARERREREEQEGRERREREEREAQERREREEREAEERRERIEKEAKERVEREAQERREREDREAQEKKEREEAEAKRVEEAIEAARIEVERLAAETERMNEEAARANLIRVAESTGPIPSSGVNQHLVPDSDPSSSHPPGIVEVSQPYGLRQSRRDSPPAPAPLEPSDDEQDSVYSHGSFKTVRTQSTSVSNLLGHIGDGDSDIDQAQAEQRRAKRRQHNAATLARVNAPVGSNAIDSDPATAIPNARSSLYTPGTRLSVIREQPSTSSLASPARHTFSDRAHPASPIPAVTRTPHPANPILPIRLDRGPPDLATAGHHTPASTRSHLPTTVRRPDSVLSPAQSTRALDEDGDVNLGTTNHKVDRVNQILASPQRSPYGAPGNRRRPRTTVPAPLADHSPGSAEPWGAFQSPFPPAPSSGYTASPRQQRSTLEHHNTFDNNVWANRSRSPQRDKPVGVPEILIHQPSRESSKASLVTRTDAHLLTPDTAKHGVELPTPDSPEVVRPSNIGRPQTPYHSVNPITPSSPAHQDAIILDWNSAPPPGQSALGSTSPLVRPTKTPINTSKPIVPDTVSATTSPAIIPQALSKSTQSPNTAIVDATSGPGGLVNSPQSDVVPIIPEETDWTVPTHTPGRMRRPGELSGPNFGLPPSSSFGRARSNSGPAPKVDSGAPTNSASPARQNHPPLAKTTGMPTPRMAPRTPYSTFASMVPNAPYAQTPIVRPLGEGSIVPQVPSVVQVNPVTKTPFRMARPLGTSEVPGEIGSDPAPPKVIPVTPRLGRPLGAQTPFMTPFTPKAPSIEPVTPGRTKMVRPLGSGPVQVEESPPEPVVKAPTTPGRMLRPGMRPESPHYSNAPIPPMYPVMGTPHPGMQPIYNGMNTPHPVMQAAFNGMGMSHPGMQASFNGMGTPHPGMQTALNGGITSQPLTRPQTSTNAFNPSYTPNPGYRPLNLTAPSRPTPSVKDDIIIPSASSASSSDAGRPKSRRSKSKSGRDARDDVNGRKRYTKKLGNEPRINDHGLVTDELPKTGRRNWGSPDESPPVVPPLYISIQPGHPMEGLVNQRILRSPPGHDKQPMKTILKTKADHVVPVIPVGPNQVPPAMYPPSPPQDPNHAEPPPVITLDPDPAHTALINAGISYGGALSPARVPIPPSEESEEESEHSEERSSVILPAERALMAASAARRKAVPSHILNSPPSPNPKPRIAPVSPGPQKASVHSISDEGSNPPSPMVPTHWWS